MTCSAFILLSSLICARLGFLYYVSASSDILGDALNQLARYGLDRQ